MGKQPGLGVKYKLNQSKCCVLVILNVLKSTILKKRFSCADPRKFVSRVPFVELIMDVLYFGDTIYLLFITTL